MRTPYWPLEDADRFDRFWGAKLIMKLGPAQIRAAVEEAQFSDPRATEYIVQQLVRRQRKTAYYWFHQVNPLDEFAVHALAGAGASAGAGSGYQLCFSDLLLKYWVMPKRPASRTVYEMTGFDYDGRETGWRQAVIGGTRGRVCVDGPPPPRRGEGYTIVRIRTRRPGLSHDPVLLHLARGPASGAVRIIGLRRL